MIKPKILICEDRRTIHEPHGCYYRVL